MKIAGWEVPPKLLDSVAEQMKVQPFDVAHVRGFAQATGLLPTRDLNAWYISDEIGTRIISKFKREGKIEPVGVSRLWKWR